MLIGTNSAEVRLYVYFILSKRYLFVNVPFLFVAISKNLRQQKIRVQNQEDPDVVMRIGC